MRAIVGLVSMLLLSGWIACRVDIPASGASASAPLQWRRTRDGWEARECWQLPIKRHAAIHPLTLSLWEVTAALALFVSELKNSAPRGPESPQSDLEPPHARCRRGRSEGVG